MLKVAIVGCGKIADDHANQILGIANCELVGFCDKERLMARQMQDRFRRGEFFDDVHELLRRVKPDVVHITTPPQSHYDLARTCLVAGCHVYVEKPFTIVTQQAEDLVRFSTERNLKLTVGHNLMFTAAARRMRSLIGAGFLGGSPVHIESYYCYNLGDAAYARAFFGDSSHWLRRLPGGLFQNIISHGISRIAEHLTSDSPTVIAHAFASPLLQSMGEIGIQDELRVIVEDNARTAYFTFSTQMRPQLGQLRVYGTRNGLVLDDSHHTVIKLRGTKYKSYLENVIPPISLAGQYASNAATNLKDFLSWKLNMNAGLKTLIESFYRSIDRGQPVPIPYREILLTSRIMDAIFEQIGRRPAVAHR